MDQTQTLCNERWWSVFRILPRMAFLLKLPGRAAFFVRPPHVSEPTITPEARDAALQQIYTRPDYVSPPDMPVEPTAPTTPPAPESNPRMIGRIKRTYPAQRRRRQRHRRRR